MQDEFSKQHSDDLNSSSGELSTVQKGGEMKEKPNMKNCSKCRRPTLKAGLCMKCENS